MGDIKGWFSLPNGTHVPIMEGQSKAEAAQKYMNSKYGKDISRLSTKNNKSKNTTFIDSKGSKINVKETSPKDFKKKLDNAKSSNPIEDAWRVDNYSHDLSDYSKDKLFTTNHGSTIAVTPDGDIISVCAKRTGNKLTEDRGRTLMEYAVKNGGKKLDSYSGNHIFYVKCGFEPVSWCKFDEKYAPPGWRKGIDKPEPIIFYKYTGKTNTSLNVNTVLKKIKMSKDYDTAQSKRDKEVK